MRHPSSTRSQARPGPVRTIELAALVLALAPAWAAACDVEWSGSRFAVGEAPPELRPPAAEKPAGEDSAAAREEGAPAPPIPAGPLLYYVRSDPSGRALAAPAAALGRDGRPRPLALPDTVSAAWRARFDSAFYGRGRELALHAASRRAGSLVLHGSRTPDPSCPPVAVGRVFVPPGSPAPGEAVAVAGGTWPAEPGPATRAEVDRGVRVYAPILAERLLRERGVERAFRADLAHLAPVRYPGSARSGMAATYLLGDTLAPVAPPDSAVSLFYLARHDSVRGYEPNWVRLHRYDSGAGKRIYAHAVAAEGPDGRVHFLRLVDGSSVRLAALWPDSAGAAGEITWEAPRRCSALGLVDEAAGTDARRNDG